MLLLVHESHQCSKVSSLLIANHSELQSLVQPACEYAKRANASIGKLRQDFESIESNRKMCKETVSEMFRKLHAAVDEREKALLSKIDSYIDKKISQVARQRKNLVEVQDQLYQCIQEIQQALDGTLSDISLLLMDKQRLTDNVDAQEQSILDIENSLSNTMFSSTYIGFCDDNIQGVERQINMLIALCEILSSGRLRILFFSSPF